MNRRRQAIFSIFLVVCIVFGSFISSAQSRRYFYDPLPYGSEASFHPVSVLMNGGLDVLQSYFGSPRYSDITWNTGATSVWRSTTAPGYWIKQYGWNRFLRQEVFPTSLDAKSAQWAPNYILHTICGGMEYRKLSEWYEYQNVPLPRVAGAVTAMAYHYVNEIIENGPDIRPNIDAIADLLIFDPLGILLFQSDGVSEYFSSTWQLNDWSPQPAVSFSPFAFRNFSHSFVGKLRFTSSGTTGLFLHLGKASLIGLTFKNWGEESFSFGLGGTQTGVWEVDTRNQIPTRSIHVGFSAGVFYDRNNSLLASILLSEYYLERFRANIYPGVLNIGPWTPGFFIAVGPRWSISAGINIFILPVGFAFTSP